MKASGFNNRSESNDLSDLVFILRKMSDEGIQFENLDGEDNEVYTKKHSKRIKLLGTLSQDF